jgi:DNA-binding winged helix-turn-helix (wHTH) protein
VVTFEFTPFVLDPAKRVLLRGGVPQTLTPRAFDLLLLLVQQRDRVLSKDEILRTVWADTVVEESNLNQQVFVLRKALNGDGHGPEYIATIPRRGYRFVGEVTERSATPSPPSDTRSAAIDERGRFPVSRWLLGDARRSAHDRHTVRVSKLARGARCICTDSQRDRISRSRAISQHLAGRQFRRVLVDRTES